MERMPTVKVKEARTCFVQEAKKLEKFGKANAIRHLVELEFPLSIFCRLWKYEEEGKVQKKAGCGRPAGRNRDKRTPVNCFKGHPKGDSTRNWPQSLNKLKTTVAHLEASRNNDLSF